MSRKLVIDPKCRRCDNPRDNTKRGLYCAPCRKKARASGLEGVRPIKRKYFFTKEEDDYIAELYSNKLGNRLQRFVRRYPHYSKISHQALLYRAKFLKVDPKLWDQSYSEAERKIATEDDNLTISAIQEKLRLAGFHRSMDSIVNFLKTTLFSRFSDGLSIRMFSILSGLDYRKVKLFIDSGKLKVIQRGEKGAWSYIDNRDIRRFIIKNIHEFNLTHVDPAWLIDTLCPGEIDKEIRADLDKSAREEKKLEQRMEAA